LYRPPGDDLEADTEKVREMLNRGESLCEDLCSDEELGKIGEGSPIHNQPPSQEASMSELIVIPQDQLEALFIPFEEDKASNESCQPVQELEGFSPSQEVKVDEERCSNNEESCEVVKDELSPPERSLDHESHSTPDQEAEKVDDDLKQPEGGSNEEESSKTSEEPEIVDDSGHQENNNSNDEGILVEEVVSFSPCHTIEIEDSLSQELRVSSDEGDCKPVQEATSFSFSQTEKVDADLGTPQDGGEGTSKSSQAVDEPTKADDVESVEEVPELMQPDFSRFPRAISLEAPQSSPITIDLTDSPSENDSPAHRPRKRLKVDEVRWNSELDNNSDIECVVSHSSDTGKSNPSGEGTSSDNIKVSKCQTTDREKRPFEPRYVLFLV
jgi:hypothetical protein